MQSSRDGLLFEKRFWKKVDTGKSEDDCWIWQGKKNNYGYGIICREQKDLSAHRVAYEFFYGEIDNGMTLDHLCRNRSRVNPLHLQEVTNVENVLRGESIFAQKKRQTHCIHGHELSGSNLRIRPDGHRACRACARISSSKYYHQRKKES